MYLGSLKVGVTEFDYEYAEVTCNAHANKILKEHISAVVIAS